MTHTYAVLYVSDSTYKEIERLLREAGYHDHFVQTTHPHPSHAGDVAIDMHGIALKKISKNQLDI